MGWDRVGRETGILRRSSGLSRSRETCPTRLWVFILPKEGLQQTQLDEWAEAVFSGLTAPRKSKTHSAESKRIKGLARELRRKQKAVAEAATLLIPQKTSPGELGGRGRRYGSKKRQVIPTLLDQAVCAGARLSRRCEVIDRAPRTLQR